MSFLSTETLKQRLSAIIEPFDIERINNCSYELSLGTEYFATPAKLKKTLKKREQFLIAPGQFALLITKEEVKMPLDCIAFISIKYSFKKSGLINVSGFHVDPGFQGKITFSVYNSGSRDIVLEEGIPIFLIWFAYLDLPTIDKYNGKHVNQTTLSYRDIMELRGDTVSPPVLKSEIDNLRKEVKWLKNILKVSFVILLTILFTMLLTKALQ